ncbi:SDR family NAD(P)-dependent oxidoreductase [Streptomyces sp. XM4011]|uniref:SDR family NAD(P)-dependent oxidoreductase n=1 Tax=Streptomyces sp. XM4011 TaxID=2929780 RepID=UPI001FFBDAA1|nr:SDR family NAD(P)-dependent oxidoreductase [Streptomyces sp. XM4011]MCK1812900.1 SDR family NAD(P)-dependent oxidoreductase [Streptomyces sp. XM4011]
MTDATRTLVMTGATGGIGLEAAREVLRRSPETHLVLLARESSAARVLPGLRDISPHVSAVAADLAAKDSVGTAAARVEDLLEAGGLPPLRGIVCNAGVHLSDALHTSEDGYELTFAVNVLATHLLLRRLHLQLRAPSRIVVTVSDAHFGDLRHTGGIMPAPRWSEPEVLFRPGAYPRSHRVRSGGRRAYTTSKLGAIHLVHEWARRLPGGIDILSYNPSLVTGTGLPRAMGGSAQFTMKWLVPVLEFTPLVDTPPAAGRKLADVVLGRTSAPTGSYIHRTRAMRSSAESYDADREQALWEWLERQT